LSKSEKLKEQVNNLRGLLVAMFSLFLLFLTGRIDDRFEYVSIFTIVVVTIYSYIQMNKKLEELENE